MTTGQNPGRIRTGQDRTGHGHARTGWLERQRKFNSFRVVSPCPDRTPRPAVVHEVQAYRHAGQPNMCLALRDTDTGSFATHARAVGVQDAGADGQPGFAPRGTSGVVRVATPGPGANGGTGARASGHGFGVGSAGPCATPMGWRVADGAGGGALRAVRGRAVQSLVAGRAVMPRKRAGQGQDTGGTRGGTARPVVPDVDDPSFSAGVGVRGTLASLARDPKATGTARASAARTLAEMDGLIGRHQTRPDRAAGLPVEDLSRADLIAELSRLRARCMS